jgi:hypothetical protein
MLASITGVTEITIECAVDADAAAIARVHADQAVTVNTVAGD